MSYRSNIEDAMNDIENEVDSIKGELVIILDLITDLESLISEDIYDTELQDSLVYQIKSGVSGLLNDTTRLGKELY